MKTAEVLLIDPPWIIHSSKNVWKNIGSCLPSLGIAYIAAYIEKHGHSVEIIDCTAEKIGLEELKRYFTNHEPPRFVGITSTTPLITSALKIAELAKVHFPKAIVVMGGVHPTVLPEDVLNNNSVDVVVRGEGEETFLEILKGTDIKDTLGISYRSSGKIIHNPDRPLIKDIDCIPPPSYHLLPMKKYYPATGSYRRLPAMSIFATRGCMGRCTFCYRTFFGKVRRRSAQNIFEEVIMLYNEYGIKEIAFYDDSFTAFKDNVMAFCGLLKAAKINLSWSCFTRADLIDEALLKEMKSAGCHLVMFGVESADEKILKSINKGMSLEDVKTAVRLARKYGINTRASFMIGNQGETEESVKRTINFAIELDTDQVHFNIATAYPGTELYVWAKNNNYLVNSSWDDMNMSHNNLKLPGISQEKVEYYYKLAHNSFYLRPKIILRRLLNVSSLEQFISEIRGFFAILKVFGK